MFAKEVNDMLKRTLYAILKWLKGTDPLEPKEQGKTRPPRC